MSGQDPEDQRPPGGPDRESTPDQDAGSGIDPGRTDHGPESDAPGSDAVTGGGLSDDLEERKPLYRDEVPGAEEAPKATRPEGSDGAQDDTEARTRITSRPKPPPEDATQILPRTRRAGYIGARSDFDRSDDDDLDDLEDLDDQRPPMAQRTKLALLIAGVAAVAIVGLAIGYAVLNLGDQPTTTPSGQTSASVSTPGGSASPSDDPNVILTDASMLTAAQARAVDSSRTWKVALTQRGVDDTSRQPACLDAESLAGQPPSQQTVLRLLSSSGKGAPGILHQADAYATPEEATQAYALSAKALGGCAMTGAYIDSGHLVSGLGDQAVGVVLNVTTDGKTVYRSVVLSRTGRVVNVVDVAQPDKAVKIDGVANAAAAVTNVQCSTATGTCAAKTTVKDGPPPLGGDQPGFLAAGDLPPVGSPDTTWAGTVPGLPDADFTGSGCETTNWVKTEAVRRAARTYLLQDDSPTFGLDNIVLTHKDAKAAEDLAKKVKDDWDSCAKRKLTATVSEVDKVDGVGASGTEVVGWTATVEQKTTAGTAKYRVGIVSAGTKTVFTFLNPQQKLDLTDDEWHLVAVRAGQRATQVK
ncbi:MAG: hypothetical protein ABWX96_14160 [Propionibacteriaceae bacterium]